MRLCERIAQLRIVLADELHAEIGHQLEARQQRAGRALRERQEVERRVRRFERGQRRDLRGRQRMQLHHGGRDDAERAFRADEQIAQVVAGVVLAQSAQAVPDLALRRHDLEAETELARVAVAQHRGAARVRRQVAADRAAAFRREAEREQAAAFARACLHVGEDHARFDGDRVVVRIERAHAIEPRQAQHGLRA